MSLCISVVTQEGLVMAGESRTTQVIAQVNRTATDHASKVFALTDTLLACTSGWAFMRPSGATFMRSIAALIEDFKVTVPAGSDAQAASELLRTYFDTIYKEHIAHFPGDTLPDGHASVQFVVGGYDSNQIGKLFSIGIPSGSVMLTPVRSTDKAPGAWWSGQVDVIARIINGYDFRALNLPFVQAGNKNGEAKAELDKLGYFVPYESMTVQDAIDFAVGLIQVTITIQKFTAGTIAQPGSVAGVGGAIDVAVARPGKSIQWIARKDLHP